MTNRSQFFVSEIVDRMFRGPGGVALIHAFFDESYGQKTGSGRLVVSGYGFNKSGIRQFESEWQKMLDRHGLEYFRMSECNAAEKCFKGKDAECDIAARTAIQIIKKYARFGFGVCVDQDDFREILSQNGFTVSPYSFCVWFALIGVQKFRSRYPNSKKLSLVFEDSDEAGQALNLVTRLKSFVADGDNISVSFVPKKITLGCQAADIITWHLHKDLGREIGPRRDFAELLDGIPHDGPLLDRAALLRIKDELEAISGSLDLASKAFLDPKNPVFSQVAGR